MKNSYKLGLAAIAASVALVGCGGGSSSSTPAAVDPVFGKMIDAAVKGLHYTTATQDAYTDENGTYSCLPGEQVTFSVGTLELGKAECGALITPRLLDRDTVFIENIPYFLQNLDANKSNTDTLDVSNLKDFDFSDVNLSDSTFNFQQDVLVAYNDKNISDLLDKEDTTLIGHGTAVQTMDDNIAAAETNLEEALTAFVSGSTFAFASPDTEGDVVFSFESNGDFNDNDGCAGAWSVTDYNTVQVEGGCTFSIDFIGTPEDGVYVEANATDENPAGDLYTGTLTTVGTALKNFVTGKTFAYVEGFEITFGDYGAYSDNDGCSGTWMAVADNRIEVVEPANCKLSLEFVGEIADGMTMNATASDGSFTGTITELK